MARGKFNKRGGGKRVDAQSADEIEQRNERLAEFEETRTKRRAEEEEAQNGGGTSGDGEKKEGGDEKSSATETTKKKGSAPKAEDKGPEVPVIVTSAEDHKKNLKKLEFVRRRREVAEKRRKEEEEAELEKEKEEQAHYKALAAEAQGDDADGKKKKKKSKDKEIDKLTKIEIKKMKPAQMKDALKERGLDIQGNKNVLTTRLIEFEGNR